MALLVTLGSALAFVMLWLEAGDRRPVIAIAAPVVAGEVLDDDDLTVVQVAADATVELISADDLDEVVGRTAAVHLTAGALLTSGQLGRPVGLDASEAVVTVALGRPDVPQLSPGDTVELVGLSGRNGDSALALGEARVLSTEEIADYSGTLSVSLVVPRARLLEIQAAAGAGRIRVALVAP